MRIYSRIAILGSTGSIGTQTLEIVRENKDIIVTALAAGSNIELLEQQIREFHPRMVAVYDESKAIELAHRIQDLGIDVYSGMDGLLEVARISETDMLVTAIVGMIGIQPTIQGIQSGKDIALANKETLVTAGHIIMPLAQEHGVTIYPVDSEHSAIYQCIQSNIRNHGFRLDRSMNCDESAFDDHSNHSSSIQSSSPSKNELHRILLTASGGPFYDKTREELELVQVEDALKHPNWVMGKKITIDSATMVNKGLEVIEAKWLFGVDFDQIEVVIQPKSIIHSMVEFVDGAVLAQLGTPDMKLPIQYALYRGERRFLPGDRLDFKTMGQIVFKEPKSDVFEGLPLAFKAGRIGGSMPTVFNASNEMAVALFLDRKISFVQITEVIKAMMDQHQVISNPNLEEILAVEQETYQQVREYLNLR